MTIYTPTKAWVQNYKLGKAQRFEGKIDIIPLNLNSKNVLSISAKAELKAVAKTSSLKNSPMKTSDAQYVCTSVNVWVQVPYQCASGMGHWPWDFFNIIDPDLRPGYNWVSQVQTTCAWIQNDPPPTGTGETTPNPPPGYDPCDTGLPEGTELPVGTIDETPCDSTSVQGTYAIPEDPYLPGEDHPAIDPKKFAKCFNNISNVGATYKVIVQVLEPVPGTSLNWSPNNGVGHKAITLIKQGSNGIKVTQTVGFYPSANKFSGPSKLVNNSDETDYTIRMIFDMGNNSADFNNILNGIENPPSQYVLFGMN